MTANEVATAFFCSKPKTVTKAGTCNNGNDEGIHSRIKVDGLGCTNRSYETVEYRAVIKA